LTTQWTCLLAVCWWSFRLTWKCKGGGFAWDARPVRCRKFYSENGAICSSAPVDDALYSTVLHCIKSVDVRGAGCQCSSSCHCWAFSPTRCARGSLPSGLKWQQCDIVVMVDTNTSVHAKLQVAHLLSQGLPNQHQGRGGLVQRTLSLCLPSASFHPTLRRE
jgi:hypothetical protein